LNHLSEEWKKENSNNIARSSPVSQAADKLVEHSSAVGRVAFEVHASPSVSFVPMEDDSSVVPIVLKASTDVEEPIQADGNIKNGDGGDARENQHFLSGEKRVVKRTSLCPPGRFRSVKAGPWSLEWVNRQKRVVTAEVIPSAANVTKKSISGAPRVTKRKGGGNMHHSAQRLKRIARLSNNDRKEVLRALRKTHRRRKVVSFCSK